MDIYDGHIPTFEEISYMETKYEPSGFEDTWKDEFGAVYTYDQHKLIKGVNTKRYIVNPRTFVICDNAFESCDELEEIVLPDSLYKIGRSAFSACTCLKTVIIPESIIEIGDFAFSCCTLLESIVLPNNLRNIGKYVFDCCTQLHYVNITCYIEILTEGLFYNCES